MQNASRFIFTAPLALAAMVAAFGCKSQAEREAEAEADRQVERLRRVAVWDEQPTGIKQEPVAVTQGRTPLVHLFDIGGPVRVVDLTSRMQLAAATVADRTLVRIDDHNGVTVGQKNLLPGPLPEGHEYAIYLDPTMPNVVRHGVGPPGDVPRYTNP